MKYGLFFSVATIVSCGHAFVHPSSSSAFRSASFTTALASSNDNDDPSILDKIQTSFKIAQESNAAGFGFKQVLADVLAGDDYDKDAISASIEETIASSPCGTYRTIPCLLYLYGP